MITATRWIDKEYLCYWYYTNDGKGKITSARLFKQETAVSVSELVVTVVDKRSEYYERVLKQGSRGGKTDSKPVE